MLHSVMFWNEPNNVSHWDSTIDPTWAQFAQMVAGAGEAVATVNPRVLRVLGQLADPGQETVAPQVGGCLDLKAVRLGNLAERLIERSRRRSPPSSIRAKDREWPICASQAVRAVRNAHARIRQGGCG